jgi:hypothetical protein
LIGDGRGEAKYGGIFDKGGKIALFYGTINIPYSAENSPSDPLQALLAFGVWSSWERM